MAERGLNTFADLGDSHAIWAFCDPCRRSVQLRADQLANKFGADFTIAELRQLVSLGKSAAVLARVRERESRKAEGDHIIAGIDGGRLLMPSGPPDVPHGVQELTRDC